MGIIERLRTNKVLQVIVILGLFGFAAIILSIFYWPQRKFSTTQAYFSDDDGRSWYVDDINNIPPYQHNGKEGVRAVVYSYANGSKQFCGFLMRFPNSVRARLDSAIASAKARDPHATAASVAYGIEFSDVTEVKKPNSPTPWVSLNSPEAPAVQRFKSPDGSELDTVLP